MDNNNKKLITQEDLQDIMSPEWLSDSERIKSVSKAYKNIGIAKSFSIFYNTEVSQEIKSDKNINNAQSIQLGEIYGGLVKDFSGQRISFEVPGIKDELICKENFNSCKEAIQDYLLTNGNAMYFEIREKKNGKYYVSVLNAYYKLWVSQINKSIKHEDPITVHIDELTKGGYLCHTNINTLTQLTKKEYTHSVFIPGSHIVLNIEHDFNSWIGKDVEIIPQKFVEFKKVMNAGVLSTENSLVGSRKRLLQIKGQENLNNIYKRYLLSTSKNVKNYTPEEFEGTVTGIINSNNKCGVFVELDDLYITGLMPLTSSDLLNFPPGTHVKVYVKEFEIQEGKEPFIYNKYTNKIIKCNTRPVFEMTYKG